MGKYWDPGGSEGVDFLLNIIIDTKSQVIYIELLGFSKYGFNIFADKQAIDY